MVFFLSESRIKADMLNDNVSPEYIRPAMITAQTIYLKEVIGDNLYEALEDKVKNNTLTSEYKLLLDDYIIPYLEFTTMSEMAVPSTFKQLNAGVVQAYDANINTNSIETVKYMESYWVHKAEFYQNRLSKFLEKNKDDYQEYTCGCDEITGPSNTTRSCGIFLGGKHK